jgi:hypothetical protein
MELLEAPDLLPFFARRGAGGLGRQYNCRGEHQVDGTTISCADGNADYRAMMVSAALDRLRLQGHYLARFRAHGLKQRTDWTQYMLCAQSDSMIT